MKRARIQYQQQVLNVTVNDDLSVNTESGDVIEPGAYEFLVPVENPGTIFALGLNYADHASELAFEPPKEPLVS